MAWYFDVKSCSTTKVSYVGLSFLLRIAAASFQTSLVMYAWCSMKSSTVLMWTPNILYDFLDVRYLMWECDGVNLFLIVAWFGFCW